MSVQVESNRKVLWASIGTIAVFVLWSAFAEIYQITRATGQVISSSRSQIIQAADGGVLEKLYVKEGDAVAKNQLLAMLDQTRSEAAYRETRAKVVALMAQSARLRAEVYGGSVKFPSEVDEYPVFKHEQITLLKRRQDAIQGELSGLGEAANLAKKELALNEPLLKTGDIGEVDVIRLKRQLVDIETQIAAKKNKYFQDAQAELTKVEEDLASARQAATQRKDSLDHTELRAPLAGLVKNVRLTTIGAVVKPGEEVLQIVPADDDLIVEVRVKPQDVAHLKPGLPANVKIDAYDYTIYGSLSGTLTYLSPDTLSEDIKPNEQPYFRAQIKTSGRQFSARPHERIDIQPGMTATVEIITGHNTVLKFLTKPMIKTVTESFHER